MCIQKVYCIIAKRIVTLPVSSESILDSFHLEDLSLLVVFLFSPASCFGMQHNICTFRGNRKENSDFTFASTGLYFLVFVSPTQRAAFHHLYFPCFQHSGC